MRASCTTKLRGQQGRVTVELLLLTPLFVLMVALLVQMFLANGVLFRSTTTAHALLFQQAYAHNCPTPNCPYNTDGTGKLVWTPRRMPEVVFPLLRPFKTSGADKDLRLWSNSPLNNKTRAECPGRPCKETQLGVGGYRSWTDVFGMAGMWPDPVAWLVLNGF